MTESKRVSVGTVVAIGGLLRTKTSDTRGQGLVLVHLPFTSGMLKRHPASLSSTSSLLKKRPEEHVRALGRCGLEWPQGWSSVCL